MQIGVCSNESLVTHGCHLQLSVSRSWKDWECGLVVTFLSVSAEWQRIEMEQSAMGTLSHGEKKPLSETFYKFMDEQTHLLARVLSQTLLPLLQVFRCMYWPSHH